MRIITRTIYGSRLQTELLLGLPYVPVTNTTLNEKFGIQSGVVPDSQAVPRVRYFCIGNGGHRNEVGGDGQPYVSAIQHAASDAALYKHLPFLIREPDSDLTALERQRYALRKQITVNGDTYIAYYAKRLDFTNVAAEMKHNTVSDGITSSIPFVPTGANLNPTAPAIPSTGVVTTNGDYLSASAVLNLNFSEQDVAELINVATILFANPLYAVISEIGLVAGVDKVVSAPAFGGGSFNYSEVVSAQITTHITAHYPVQFSNLGFDFGVEIGATEPLVGVVSE